MAQRASLSGRYYHKLANEIGLCVGGHWKGILL